MSDIIDVSIYRDMFVNVWHKNYQQGILLLLLFLPCITQDTIAVIINGRTRWLASSWAAGCHLCERNVIIKKACGHVDVFVVM